MFPHHRLYIIWKYLWLLKMLVYGSPSSFLKKTSLKKSLFIKSWEVFITTFTSMKIPHDFFSIIIFILHEHWSPLLFNPFHHLKNVPCLHLVLLPCVINPYPICYAAPRRDAPRCLPDTGPHRDVWHSSASAAVDGRAIAARTQRLVEARCG